MTTGPVDPEIEAIVTRRGVNEVLHFTSNRGLLGILVSESIQPRALLEADEYLSAIFTANAPVRRDPAWIGHVSLSISRINTSFFGYSTYTHADEGLWWCVLSIDPEVLGHDGVVFCTVNNIWPKVERDYGANGLEALFADRVIGSYDRVITRPNPANDAWPTCIQAEVLYPGKIPSTMIQRIYFDDAVHRAAGEAQIATVEHSAIPCEVNPSVFVTGAP